MRQSIASQRARHSDMERRIRDMIRRVDVKLSGLFWQLLGYDDGDSKEGFNDTEAFQGIGFSSRPQTDSDAEAIVVNLGASAHAVIVATRDKSIELDIGADETVIYNSTGAKTYIKADGSIAVTAAPGKTVSVDDGSGAVELPLKSDNQAIITAITNAVPLAQDGGLQFKTQILSALSGFPVGTTVLKGK